MPTILAVLFLLFPFDVFATDNPQEKKPVSVEVACYLPCDMIALNKAYIELVQQHRKDTYGKTADAHFDRNMFYRAFNHNIEMEKTDSLYHDYITFNAEMVGGMIGIEGYRNNPTKLAEYIFTKFDMSKSGHHETQMDVTNTYICITCTSRYFVVRMNSRPDGYDKDLATRFEFFINKKKAAN